MRTLTRFARLSAAPLLLVVTGCTKGDNAGDKSGNGPVTATEVHFAQVDAAIKQNKGKVVLIDVWAMWCGPCVRSFPHFVELHQKYSNDGLVCMSVNIDKISGRGYDKEDILKFLKDKGATFPHFILTDGRDQLVPVLGYAGFIPHKALFDKAGNRIWDSSVDNLSDKELAQKIEMELRK